LNNTTTMATSIRLRVKLSERTLTCFRKYGINIQWDEEEELNIQCPCPKSPLTIEEIGEFIQTRVESLYFQLTGGQDECQAQVQGMWCASSPEKELPWNSDSHASHHLKNGDALLVDCVAITISSVRSRQPQLTEEQLDRIRSTLRFNINDRVLCFCGPRWVSGLVVGTAVLDTTELLPYLVKTDPLPGMPSKTISVPSDTDDICTQEVCFDPLSQMHLVLAAAQLVNQSARPKLRFTTGDKVVVRIRNSAEDGLENWVAGTVGSTWPKLPGKKTWELDNISGEFPDTLPYKVDLSTGNWLYCHRDHQTLIRREGFQPQTRVKGISARMEVRRAKDGSMETVDHHTERCKRKRDHEAELQ